MDLQPHATWSLPQPEGAPVSVILPVKNEEQNLPDALASVSFADQVIVVDSHSEDGTVNCAHAAGAEVVQFDYAGAGPKKKAWALRNLRLRHTWALLLDADERITPELRAEILDAVARSEHDGYYIDREFIFMGKSLRCFRPNWNMRLFKHERAEMEDLGLHDLPGTGDNEIHEHITVSGSTGYLQHALLHNDYRGITPWLERHNKYATWEAHLYRKFRAEPLDLGLLEFLRLDPFSRKRMLRRVWVRLPLRPPLRFFAWYIGRRGFADGQIGFVFCVLMAYYELIINLKIKEVEHS